MKTLIQNGTLVVPEGPMRASLLMDGDTIAAIGDIAPDAQTQTIDAFGCLVLPGAIDTHTHFDLPVSGTVTADDFASGTLAALMGGTTTILDFATQDHGSTLRQAYDAWRAKMDGRASCDVGFHMAIVDWNEATAREIADMGQLGITSFKLYMAYPALMVPDDVLYAALVCIRDAGGIVGVHCENGHLVTKLTEDLRCAGHTSAAAHPLSRPPEVEAEAIARLLRIAQLAQAPVNIVHLSSREGLEAVRRTQRRGQRVFVETCPQYLLLDDALLLQEDGEKYVCSPPLRTRADCEALWEAVVGGEVDTIGTDHCSFRYADQKLADRDDFTRIPNGLPGVEHRLPLMMTEGVAKGRLTAAQVVRLLCENPAKLFGLYPKKGRLAVGSDADVVLWDPQRAGVIRAQTQYQRVDYTPYEGWEVAGAVRDVWLRGTHAVQNGSPVVQGAGEFLKRRPIFH